MAVVKEPLVKEFLEEHEDGVVFYDVHPIEEGKAVLQVETGIIYGGCAITDDDPYTYEQCDDPYYVPETEEAPVEE